MSGGQSDAVACEEIGNAVEFSAMELSDAIKRAKEGHRGLTVDWMKIANDVLSDAGVRIVRERG